MFCLNPKCRCQAPSPAAGREPGSASQVGEGWGTARAFSRAEERWLYFNTVQILTLPRGRGGVSLSHQHPEQHRPLPDAASPRHLFKCRPWLETLRRERQGASRQESPGDSGGFTGQASAATAGTPLPHGVTGSGSGRPGAGHGHRAALRVWPCSNTSLEPQEIRFLLFLLCSR